MHVGEVTDREPAADEFDGPGMTSVVHSPDELVEVVALVQACETLQRFASGGSA